MEENDKIETGKDGSTSFSEDPFFESEDSILEDKIVVDEKARKVLMQRENLVDVKITGLYVDENDDSDFRVKNRLLLRTNPPKLEITGFQDGEEIPVYFDLTETFTEVLRQNIENVDRAYHGLKPKRDLTFKEASKENLVSAQNWIMDHKIITALLALFVVFIVVTNIF